MPFDKDSGLFDAIVRSLTVDFCERTVEIKLEAYQNVADRLRRSLLIKLSGTGSLNCISDLIDLKVNSAAGNVQFMRFSNSSKFYLHLASGLIEVSAEDVAFIE